MEAHNEAAWPRPSTLTKPDWPAEEIPDEVAPEQSSRTARATMCSHAILPTTLNPGRI